MGLKNSKNYALSPIILRIVCMFEKVKPNI